MGDLSAELGSGSVGSLVHPLAELGMDGRCAGGPGDPGTGCEALMASPSARG